MENSATNVLKGQHNLAQGFALGLQTCKGIVRDKMITKERFPFRTKEIIIISRKKMPFYSVRKKVFTLKIMFSRTGSYCVHIFQGDAVRLSAHAEALGCNILALQAVKK